MRQYVVGMNRVEQFKDVLGVALATLAIALSLLTVLLQRRQHQRDAYRQIYESLMSDALQRGRWLINDVAATGVMPEDPADVRLMYRTLGTFDNLAMYIRHRLVPRTWVMDVWHHPLREMRQGSEIVRAAVRHVVGFRPIQSRGLNSGNCSGKRSFVEATCPAAVRRPASPTLTNDRPRPTHPDGCT
jgi:hypothetical protein